MFHNIEIKKFTYCYIIFAIIILITGNLGINICADNIDKEYKALLYTAVNESYNDENLREEAVEKLEKSGAMDYKTYKYAEEKLKGIQRVKVFSNLFLDIVLLSLYLISLLFINNIYKKIRKISSNTEKIIKKDFKVENDSYDIGDFGVLNSNFAELVKVIKEGQEREEKEKIFLRDIISDISHQLKTPLSSLMVFNDILSDNLNITKEEKNQILLESKNQLNRLEWLILSMLKLARIEAKSIAFNMKEDIVYDTIMGCIEILDIKIKEKNHKIILNCNKEITLMHDREWLQEAIINILKNAIEYTEKNGKILIEVEKSTLLTNIKIIDNGIGIDEKDIPKIFQRFYRTNNRLNPSSVGIGLALTKTIIEGQGGRIGVESVKGEYSCFIITFLSNKFI